MKRVLIVSYFFPPVSNMGSHRVLRFVRHLRETGWEPVILTGQFAGWKETDDHLLTQIPPDVEVLRVGSLDLTELWKKIMGKPQPSQNTQVPTVPPCTGGLTTFLNRWVMIPDKYFPWIHPAANAGVQLIRKGKFAAIYSTSDPVSDHLVARRIARHTGLPWVAEFRDLWLGSPYFARAHPTPLHRAVHARLEQHVAADASLIVGLSSGIRDYFANAYPQRSARVIYNAFDPLEYATAPVPPVKFSMVYAGAFYSSRSPETFFEGLGQFIKHCQLTPASAEFVIVGGSPDLDLAAMADRHGVTKFVQFAGRVPHAEALQRMQAATILLALQSPDDTVHVPGKLFEYIGARRPIFAVSRPCEAARLILENHLGWVAAPTAAAVATELAAAFAAWQTNGHGGLTLKLADKFSIRDTTQQLADALNSVSGQP